jgi:hypothetical protein
MDELLYHLWNPALQLKSVWTIIQCSRLLNTNRINYLVIQREFKGD